MLIKYVHHACDSLQKTWSAFFRVHRTNLKVVEEFAIYLINVSYRQLVVSLPMLAEVAKRCTKQGQLAKGVETARQLDL